MANKKNDILNVQPHSDEAEQAVLGSMLSDKEAVNKSAEYLANSFWEARDLFEFVAPGGSLDESLELAIYSEGSISIRDSWEMTFEERNLAVKIINERNLRKAGKDPAQYL